MTTRKEKKEMTPIEEAIFNCRLEDNDEIREEARVESVTFYKETHYIFVS